MSDLFSAMAKYDHSLQSMEIPFSEYDRLLSYPTWNYVSAIIRKTRSFNQALAAGVRLLELTEKYKPRMDGKKYDQRVFSMTHLILDMLDKLDRWDDFIEAYTQVTQLKRFRTRYHKKVLQEQLGEFIRPYILGETNHYLILSQFWILGSRYDVIHRKIERRSRGAKLGNVVHAQQSDFSPQEIEERKKWLADLLSQSRPQHGGNTPEKEKASNQRFQATRLPGRQPSA